MRRLLSLLYITLGLLCLTACGGGSTSTSSGKGGKFDIRGAWLYVGDSLATGEVKESSLYEYPVYKLYTDSMVYKFLALDAHTFFPITMESYELGLGADTLYSEGENTIQVRTAAGDRFDMQWGGATQLWRRAADITPSKQRELVEQANEVLRGGAMFYNESNRKRFDRTLQAMRQRQKAKKLLTYGLTFGTLLLVFLLTICVFLYRRNRRMARALVELQEELDERPELLTEATARLTDELYATEWYASLRQRLTEGQHLGPKDWAEVERQVRRIHSGFRVRLYELHPMSETEFRVCLLLKLRIAPSLIATALCKDSSSISTIRSRLYAKVFGKKGSSKDWDEFIEKL